MCIECDKYFEGKDISIKDLMKVSFIKIDLIEDRTGKWYRAYCEKCGETRKYSV